MKKITYDIFKENNIPMDRDVYEYGVSIIKRYVAVLLITIPTVIIFNRLIECILFILCFLFLRRYTGGLHLKSNILCSFFSIIIILGISILAPLIKVNFIVFILVSLFLMLIILFYAPIDHPNKRLNKQEKKIYKCRAICMVVLYFLLYILFYYFNFPSFQSIIFLTYCLCTLLIIIPTIKCIK